jgi:DNA-binding CsgD family transcriptional regulator/sugar lactone lactonase YvrE
VTSRAQLSRREREVARLVAEGLTNREIAQRLFISERTVDGHLEHVREKLGVSNRAQVAAWLVKHEAAGPTTPAPTAMTEPPRRWRTGRRELWIATAVLLAILASVAAWVRFSTPPQPTIETVAGNECAQQVFPGGCFGGDGLKAINAGLARPIDVAVDHDGAIYIADDGNQRVRQVRDGIISTFVGGGGQQIKEGIHRASVDLASGSTIAIDSANHLFVLTCAAGSLEVWKVGAADLMTRVVSVGSCGAQQALPLGGLAVAASGTVFVADRVHNQVWKFDGTLSLYAGNGERGHLGDGGAAESAELFWPIGLALDDHENLFIADTGNNRIRRVDRSKRIITTVAGSGDYEGNSGDGGPAIQARLSFPFGVAVGPMGIVVVADTGNHRLRAIDSTGGIYALAGTGQWGLGGDRVPAVEAQLSGPEGLAFDAQGNLFIADTENQRVRKIARMAASRG